MDAIIEETYEDGGNETSASLIHLDSKLVHDATPALLFDEPVTMFAETAPETRVESRQQSREKQAPVVAHEEKTEVTVPV